MVRNKPSPTYGKDRGLGLPRRGRVPRCPCKGRDGCQRKGRAWVVGKGRSRRGGGESPLEPRKALKGGEIKEAVGQINLQHEAKVRGKRHHFVNTKADKTLKEKGIFTRATKRWAEPGLVRVKLGRKGESPHPAS